MKLFFQTAKYDMALSVAIITALLIHYSGFLAPAYDGELIFLIACLGAGPVVISAVRQLVRRTISMDLLASVALIFSLVSQEWASASFIALMLAASRMLQAVTERRTERSIKSLLTFRPSVANRIRDNRAEEVPIEQLLVGDVIEVDLGERIPVDGSIVAGEIAVDESSLTGESFPVDKSVGGKVFSSTMVASGSARIVIEKLGKDTTLEKIIALVESSGAHKSRFQTLGERFGKLYLIGIFALAFTILYFTGNTRLVLSVVLVACADDVAIAVPLAYLTATSAAAKRGVIVKGSGYLEALGSADTIVFDKTGTLTKGRLHVIKVVAAPSWTEHQVLSYCGAMSAQSHHPIALAIHTYVKQRNIQFALTERVEEAGGMGMYGISDGKEIVFGRRIFIESKGIRIGGALVHEVERLEGEGKSISYIALAREVIGFVALTDEIRPQVKGAVERLRRLGVANIVMLTGDNVQAANAVARVVGIDDVHARLLPEEKVAHIKRYTDASRVVAMVGDGVNDAAALRMATVGIAMGAIGYDAAIESADIVLMHDDISKIADVIELAYFVRRISKEDFMIWGASNILGLALVFGGFMGPAGAAAYNFITDFFPLINSLRTKRHSSVKTIA